MFLILWAFSGPWPYLNLERIVYFITANLVEVFLVATWYTNMPSMHFLPIARSTFPKSIWWNVFWLERFDRLDCLTNSDKYSPIHTFLERCDMTDERGDLVPLNYRDGSHISLDQIQLQKYTKNDEITIPFITPCEPETVICWSSFNVGSIPFPEQHRF